MASPLALVWELIAEDHASGVFKKVGGEAKGAAAETSNLGSSFTKAGGLIVAAGVGIAAVGVKMAVEFQESTAKIQANAQISEKAATDIGDAFLSTAGKSTFSGKEMADAFGPVSGVIQTLAGHTLNAADAQTVMTAATTLAEASGNKLDATTADLSAVMQSYGLELKDAAEASNILFNTSRLINLPLDTLTTTVDKLHGKLGLAAPDLEDVSALLVDLANHGIQGSKGVLIVNTALNTLLGGSKATNDELKTLGVNVFDSSGKFVGMSDVLDQLTPKLKGMTDQQRLAAEAAIFGKGAAKSLDETIRAGADGLEKASTAVTKHDAVEKAAEAQAKTFEGQMKTLKAAFVDIEIEIGNKVIPAVSASVGFFKDHETIAKTLGIAVVAITGFLVAYSVVTTAAGIATKVQTAYQLLFTTAVEESAVATEGAVVAQEGLNVAMAANPIGLAIVAVGALVGAYTLLKHGSDQVSASEKQFQTALSGVAGTLNQNTGAITSNTRATVAKALADSGAYDAGRKVGASIRDVTDAALGNEAATKRVNAALKAYIETHHDGFAATQASAKIAGVLTGAIGETTSALEADRKKLGQVNEAMHGLPKLTKVTVDMDTSDVQAGLKYVIATMNHIGSLSTSVKVDMHASDVGGNARGTDYWKGGLTWVGEDGPELIDLQRGAKVIPNDRVDDYAAGVATSGSKSDGPGNPLDGAQITIVDGGHMVNSFQGTVTARSNRMVER